jgi:hypothetical protein
MCEVDHADDAIDHRVADGDEAINRSQRQPVDKLLDEILHIMPLPWNVAGSGAFLFVVPLVVRFQVRIATPNFVLLRDFGMRSALYRGRCILLAGQGGTYHRTNAMSLTFWVYFQLYEKGIRIMKVNIR